MFNPYRALGDLSWDLLTPEERKRMLVLFTEEPFDYFGLHDFDKDLGGQASRHSSATVSDDMKKTIAQSSNRYGIVGHIYG